MKFMTDAELVHMNNLHSFVEGARVAASREEVRTLLKVAATAVSAGMEAMVRLEELGAHPDAARLSGDEVERLRAQFNAVMEENKRWRKVVDQLTNPVPGVADSEDPYTMEDVKTIEAFRGKSYPRLRATVEQLAILKACP